MERWSAVLMRVDPDGAVILVAEDLRLPRGTAINEDDGMLTWPRRWL